MPSETPSIVAINKFKLDEEWEGQAEKFLEVSAKAAEARALVDRRKAKLDVIEAELKQIIRLSPKKFDLEKATDKPVQEAMTTHPRYQKCLARLNQAKYELNIYDARVRAMEHRKAALEHLTSLFLRDYYAEPIVRDSETRERKDELKKKKARRSRS